MKRNDVIAICLSLVVAFLVVGVGGWRVGPEYADDVAVITETIGVSQYETVFVGIIENQGQSTYDELTVVVEIANSSGDVYQIKEYTVNALTPGERRTIIHRQCRTGDTGKIRAIWK